MPDDPKSEAPENSRLSPDTADDDSRDQSAMEERSPEFIRYYSSSYLFGAPIVLFFYMLFYFIWPEPVLFEKNFIYSIFPNLKLEHAHLVTIGREDFANNFVNYQANMVALCIISNASLYILFFLVFFLNVTRTGGMKWRALAGCAPFLALSYMYLFGIDPFSRIEGDNKLVIDAEDDYFSYGFFYLLRQYLQI